MQTLTQTSVKYSKYELIYKNRDKLMLSLLLYFLIFLETRITLNAIQVLGAFSVEVFNRSRGRSPTPPPTPSDVVLVCRVGDVIE